MDDDQNRTTTDLPEPDIIPRSEHTLSRRLIDEEALKVLYRLNKAGYQAYLVGGSVRDLLLGKRPKDFDVGTDAHPGEVRKLFRNSRVIGKRFKLVQVFFKGPKIVEVSTFRRAADPEDETQLGANNAFGTAAEDALRRDLTINALMYNIADFSIVDYVGGLADLKAGVVRGVGDPLVRFRRDPVRVLRAVRHAARAGFAIEQETLQAVRHCQADLAICPESRVRDELWRDFMGGACSSWIELAHQTGVLYTLFPALEPLFGPEDSPDRLESRRLMARVDRMVQAGNPPDPAVGLCLFLWPALMDTVRDLEPGRAGRAQWMAMLPDELARLTSPVAFARRMLERAAQIAGVLAYALPELEAERLPRKFLGKGYLPLAVELAELLELDLEGLVQGAKSEKTPPVKKKRRRRRRRKPPTTGAE